MTNSSSFDISIVVPCFQEENHLRKSVETIYALLERTNYSFEMIFVDDCSKDGTRDIILSLEKEFKNSGHLFHEKNTGRGGAFLDGVLLSKGRYVGYLDIDLEVSCVYLLDVLLELERGYDIAIVRRHYALSPSPVFILRHLLSVGYKMIVSSYLGIPRMDTETGFKFFERNCILDLAGKIQNKKWFFDTEVMVMGFFAPYKIKEVDGLFMRKTEKTSTVKLFSDTIDYFIEIYRFKKRIRKITSSQ